MSLVLCALVVLHAATVCWRLARAIRRRPPLRWASLDLGPLSTVAALAAGILGLAVTRSLAMGTAGMWLWAVGLVVVALAVVLAGAAWPTLSRPTSSRPLHFINLVITVLLLVPFGLMLR